MSEAAKQVNLETTDVEAFDELFEERASTGTSQADTESSTGTNRTCQAEPGTTEDISGWVTVEEAAGRLNISSNAVTKRLNKGRLKGKKVPGQYGDVWMIDPSGLPEEIQIRIEEEEDNPGSSKEGPGRDQGTSKGQEEGIGNTVGIADKAFDLLSEMVKHQTEQIRCQTTVIETLSEQLKRKDEEIKLLTDSQSAKTGWWERFSRWFMGR
ncbi:hypothetical protein GC174_10535 [bacterium]|nr:hypothetical protein [bacterium]